MRTPHTIRQQIAIYERRIRELECDLLCATTLLNEDGLTGLLTPRVRIVVASIEPRTWGR